MCPSLSGYPPENRNKSISEFSKESSDGGRDRKPYSENGSSKKQDGNGINGPDQYCVQNLMVVKPFFNNFTTAGYKKIKKKLGTSKTNNNYNNKDSSNFNDDCYKKQMEEIHVQRRKRYLGRIINNDYAVSSYNLIENRRDHFQTEERVISISNNGETATDTCSESTVRPIYCEKNERKLSEDSCAFKTELSDSEERSEPVKARGNKVQIKDSKSNFVLLENKKSLYSNESSRESKRSHRQPEYKNRFLRCNHLFEGNKKINSLSQRNDSSSRRNPDIFRLSTPPKKHNRENLREGNFNCNSSIETNLEKPSRDSLLFKKFGKRFPRAIMFKPSSDEPRKSKFNAISKKPGSNSKKD